MDDKCPKCEAKDSGTNAFTNVNYGCGSYVHRDIFSQSDDCRIRELEAEVQRLREEASQWFRLMQTRTPD